MHVLWGAVEVPGRTMAMAVACWRPGFPPLSRPAGVAAVPAPQTAPAPTRDQLPQHRLEGKHSLAQARLTSSHPANCPQCRQRGRNGSLGDLPIPSISPGRCTGSWSALGTACCVLGKHEPCCQIASQGRAGQEPGGGVSRKGGREETLPVLPTLAVSALPPTTNPL